MRNQVTKELSQELIKQQEGVERIEENYSKPLEENKKRIRKELRKELKQEKGGVSLAYSYKAEKTKQLKTKIAGMLRGIDSINNELDINRFNLNEDNLNVIREIEKEFTIETEKLLRAIKNIGKTIETGEDMVTLRDLKELENMMDETKQKIDTVVNEIKKDDSL